MLVVVEHRDAHALAQTGCFWSSSGAYNYILHPQNFNEGAGNSDLGMGALCLKSDGKLHGALKTGGVLRWADSGVLRAGTVYEGELNFDGAHVNLFVGPTTSAIPRVAQVTALGVINQRPD